MSDVSSQRQVANNVEMISEKPIDKMTYKEVWSILLKRIIALPSKLIGFKPFCIYLATWLLYNDKVEGWVWLIVLIAVLFGREGLKALAGLRR